MAIEETPVAEVTEETDAPEASTETEETTANEAVADSNTVEPELNASLPPVESAPAPAERVEVEGGRDYEVIFIVRITESTEAASDRARAVIEQSGGAVDNIRVSEQRRLAYPIQKEIEGFYIVLNGRFTKEAAAELDRVMKLDEAVLRHMTIRLDEE